MDTTQKLIAAAERLNRHNVEVAQVEAQMHGSILYRDYMFSMPHARALDEAFQDYYAAQSPKSK